MKRLIASGQFTATTLDGKRVTDFKALSECAVKIQNSPLKPPKRAGTAKVVQTDELLALRLNVKFPVPFVHNGVRYSLQRLEHFGDSLVWLASRQLAHELFPSNSRAYNYWSQMLGKNKTLQSAGFFNGDAAEIDVGYVFIREGSEMGLERAKTIIRGTTYYKCAVSFVTMCERDQTAFFQRTRVEQLLALDSGVIERI